jgi:hypothetical protein
MDDITTTLRNRLQILLDQVRHDQATLTAPEHAAGELAYAGLFDSLTITLHNLERRLDGSAEAAKPGGES